MSSRRPMLTCTCDTRTNPRTHFVEMRARVPYRCRPFRWPTRPPSRTLWSVSRVIRSATSWWTKGKAFGQISLFCFLCLRFFMLWFASSKRRRDYSLSLSVYFSLSLSTSTRHTNLYIQILLRYLLHRFCRILSSFSNIITVDPCVCVSYPVCLFDSLSHSRLSLFDIRTNRISSCIHVFVL